MTGLLKEQVVQWPPYAARRNLIQVNTKYTCTVLHKDFEPRRQLEPKGYGVVNKRQGNIHEYALPLREDQMLAWESLPFLSCFVWWPHHAEVFQQVKMLWQEEGILPT